MTRVPYRDWFNSLDDTGKQRAITRAMDKHAKAQDAKATGGGKRKRTYRQGKKRAYKRMRGGGGGISAGGGAIVYPNVIGRGPYRLTGGVEWGSPNSYFKGKLGGDLVSRDYVTGSGPYNVKKNSLVSALDLGMSPPAVTNIGREAFVLRHREYIMDIYSGSGSPATDFKLETFKLNPGNSQIFPFMAAIAQRFQEYEITGMLVELKSLTSDFSTNISLGSVFMAADYNVLGSLPANKQQLENMEYSSSCKPSHSLVMPIECDPRNNSNTHLYIAIDNRYDGGDERLYDWCTIMIGSQGIPSENTPLAEMWITYEVALYKPILSVENTNATTIGVKYNFTDFSANNAFGTISGRAGNDYALFPRLGPSLMGLPPDREAYYLVCVEWHGVANAVATYPELSFNGAAQIVTDYWSSTAGNNTAQGMAMELVAAPQSLTVAFVVWMKDPGTAGVFSGSFEFTQNAGFDYPTAPNYGDILITQLDPQLLT